MIIGIDHAIVAVNDLEGVMETYRRLGFQVLRGGEHPRFGTHNALVPLADGAYLELMGVKDRELAAQFPHTGRIVEALARENRLAFFALDSDALESDVEAIRARGLKMEGPLPGERVRPDGQRVAWRTAHPGDLRLPFLIADETPRELRIPPPTEGIGRTLRLAHLTVGARDTDTLRAGYERLLGVDSSTGSFKLTRGEIRVSSGEARDGIQHLVLVAEEPEVIAQEWQRRQAPFRDQVMNEFGRALIPTETAGTPIVLIGVESN